MADATTIDDLVKPEVKTSVFDDIADLVKTSLDMIKAAYNSAKTILNYGILTCAGYISSILTGPAGPITGGAMMLGKVLLNVKEGVKTKWDKLYKEGLKGIILGNLAMFFYQYVINIIPNQTVYGKIGRTLAYNPGFIGGIYNPTYLKLTEKLDGTAPEKGEWLNLTKRTFKYISPFHFLTTNYISSLQQQVAASAFLGTAYRVIAR